jgi:DNA-binding transcriptional regulator GbsR (MarR family)
MNQAEKIDTARMRLVEIGGHTSQDLGLGRIVGQLLVYLYLQPEACPLDELETQLGLSKASVSIAARQLEQLGLAQRVWVRGDRRKYYRSAENIADALQQGLLSLVRQKVREFGNQLETSMELLEDPGDNVTREVEFLKQRVTRAQKLQRRLDSILGNPIIKLLAKATTKTN